MPQVPAPPPEAAARHTGPAAVLLAAVLGSAFAMALVPLWNLEGRWFIVALLGVLMVSIAMLVAGRFSDTAFIALLFTVPLAGLSKWTFLDEWVYSKEVRDASLYSGTLGVGLVDLMLVGLYGAWAFRIFALRSEPWPRLERIDIWVGLLLLANVLSQWGAEQPLGIFALEHQLKFSALYFYVSRHFRREHLPWFLASVGFAVTAESIIGVLQFFSVLPPGLIFDKGAGGDLLEQQYRVPGIEGVIRATGSLYDSHALGTYLAMLAPFLLVFLYKGDLRPAPRLAAAGLMGLAFAALAVTYSRSAWLAFSFSAGVTVVMMLVWRDRHVGKSLFALAFVALLAGPFLLARQFARLLDAPTDLLLVRFEQFPVAWSIWQDNLLFGAGAGSYMFQMNIHNTDWRLPEPVHNVILFLGAEMGLFGVVAYYGLVFTTLHCLWTVARRPDEPWRRMAVATGAGLLAYLGDGMSNPLFREPTIYMCFWIGVGLATALRRIVREQAVQPPR